MRRRQIRYYKKKFLRWLVGAGRNVGKRGVERKERKKDELIEEDRVE